MRVGAILAATAVGEGALVHILAMSPVRQIEAHAAVAGVVARIVSTVLRAASVVDRAFIHVLATVYILCERETVATTTAVPDPADDFTEVVACSAAAGIRSKGRRRHNRLPGKEEGRHCH